VGCGDSKLVVEHVSTGLRMLKGLEQPRDIFFVDDLEKRVCAVHHFACGTAYQPVYACAYIYNPECAVGVAFQAEDDAAWQIVCQNGGPLALLRLLGDVLYRAGQADGTSFFIASDLTLDIGWEVVVVITQMLDLQP